MNNSLLPANATDLQLALEQLEFERWDLLGGCIADMWSPDLCPVELLPYLAWALSVDQWDGNWPETVKRNVIRNSIIVHKHKGTRGAVTRALAAAGVDVEIKEWFESNPTGQPHTFDLTAYVNSNMALVDEPVLNSRIYDLLKKMVNAAKRASSHYTFKVAAQFDSAKALASALSVTKFARFSATSAPLDMPFAKMATVSGLSVVKIARFNMETI